MEETKNGITLSVKEVGILSGLCSIAVEFCEDAKRNLRVTNLKDKEILIDDWDEKEEFAKRYKELLTEFCLKLNSQKETNQ
jgi:hypothetical protein